MPATFRLCVLAVLTGLAGSAWSQGIYTCVDGSGRRLTSDRPILECIDREQRVLNSRGLVQRTLPPSLTAAERAVQEERDRKVAEERQRQADEKRLQRALLMRYPNQNVHDGERAKALQTVQEAIATGQRRIGELQQERAKLRTETDFYKSPADYPPKLKRQIEDFEQQVAAQQRSIAVQEEERKRIATRFDEELARLKVLWAQAQGTAAAAAPSTEPIRR
jgi:hypothetical protein